MNRFIEKKGECLGLKKAEVIAELGNVGDVLAKEGLHHFAFSVRHLANQIGLANCIALDEAPAAVRDYSTYTCQCGKTFVIDSSKASHTCTCGNFYTFGAPKARNPAHIFASIIEDKGGRVAGMAATAMASFCAAQKAKAQQKAPHHADKYLEACEKEREPVYQWQRWAPMVLPGCTDPAEVKRQQAYQREALRQQCRQVLDNPYVTHRFKYDALRDRWEMQFSDARPEHLNERCARNFMEALEAWDELEFNRAEDKRKMLKVLRNTICLSAIEEYYKQ